MWNAIDYKYSKQIYIVGGQDRCFEEKIKQDGGGGLSRDGEDGGRALWERDMRHVSQWRLHEGSGD